MLTHAATFRRACSRSKNSVSLRWRSRGFTPASPVRGDEFEQTGADFLMLRCAAPLIAFAQTHPGATYANEDRGKRDALSA